MSNTWYMGNATVRTISAADWTAAGSSGSTVTWNAANGYSIDASTLSAGQIALLAADPDFLAGQTGTRTAGLSPKAVDTFDDGVFVGNGTGAVVAFVVSHALGTAPTTVVVTPKNAVSAALNYVSAITATTFTVTFATAPVTGTGNVTFSWLARV